MSDFLNPCRPSTSGGNRIRPIMPNYPALRNRPGKLRTLPHLPPGAVFGVVVPQGLLHSKNATPLRQFLTAHCELREICLFPDNLFNRSDMESAVLLGRRHAATRLTRSFVSYRRVRERDVDDFRRSYAVSTWSQVDVSRFSGDSAWDLRVSDLEELWLWCARFRTFSETAEVGKGFDFIGKDNLPPDSITFSERRFPGAVRGFVKLHRKILTHILPAPYWVNLGPSVIGSPRTGVVTGVPQVLLNYARVSRGPWRLKALIDHDGHAVTSRFLTVRPLSADLTLEFLWALCNSPIANAYAYAHSMKRDILAGMMRQLPVPSVRTRGIERVTEAATAYLRAVSSGGEVLNKQVAPDAARRLLLRMDAEILRLYDLPPRLERQLLDLFTGWPREGVPFTFERYFPAGFEPCFPLHEYLSAELQRSTAGSLRSQHRPIKSREWSAAMQAAVESFQK